LLLAEVKLAGCSRFLEYFFEKGKARIKKCGFLINGETREKPD